MRHDVMGCSGHPLVQTPNLDKLAKEGRLFSNAYSCGPVCCPARRSVFTGRYIHAHGVSWNGYPANNEELLLTSVLKHYGYTTAISGKLHFHPHELAYDFDHFWSFKEEGPGQYENYPDFLERKHGSRVVYPREAGTAPWPDDALGKDVGKFAYPREEHMGCWIRDRALEFLDSQRDAEKPWFLFASFNNPHSPSVEPEPYFSMYDRAKIQVPELPEANKAIRAAREGRAKRKYPDNPEMLREMIAIYYGMVSHLDEHVGALLRRLEELGMAEDTLVIFTSDHGNMLGEKGYYFKSEMYEGSAHVPLIIRAPKAAEYGATFNTGEKEEGIIDEVDIFPTVLDMAGLPAVEQGVQGSSFLPMATGQSSHWKNRCFSCLETPILQNQMLRTARYKLIRYPLKGNRLELYDMWTDPGEHHNLAEDPDYRETAFLLEAELLAIRNDCPPPAGALPGMAIPDYFYLDENRRRELIEAAEERLRESGALENAEKRA